jgi:hypothetical protein
MNVRASPERQAGALRQARGKLWRSGARSEDIGRPGWSLAFLGAFALGQGAA